ncbi:MAG: hypothetical protein ACW98K_12360 [Candidatus Kariarchaeaceae archaeon]|jgi:hypothetical protein
MWSKTAIAIIVILVVIILAETGVGLYLLLRPKKGNGATDYSCNEDNCPSSSGKLCVGSAIKFCLNPLTIARGTKDYVYYSCPMPTSAESTPPSETPSSHGIGKKMCSVQSGAVVLGTTSGNLVMTPGAKWVGVTLYTSSNLSGNPYFDGWVPLGSEVISDPKTRTTSINQPYEGFSVEKPCDAWVAVQAQYRDCNANCDNFKKQIISNLGGGRMSAGGIGGCMDNTSSEPCGQKCAPGEKNCCFNVTLPGCLGLEGTSAENCQKKLSKIVDTTQTYNIVGGECPGC